MDLFSRSASDIVKRGFAIVQTPKHVYDLFAVIESSHKYLSEADKRDYSFEARADGFLPQGQEYAENSPEKPDLCERFCYWHRYNQDHRKHSLFNTAFHSAVRQYEREISDFGQRVLDAVVSNFGQPRILGGRMDSYVQLCIYESKHRRPGRDFLQEPHVDGHLLTFITNTSQGLAIQGDAGMDAIYLERDEMLIMAGTLMEEVTDGLVRGALHAVLPNPHCDSRRSLIYFMNPPRTVGSTRSFSQGRLLDMAQIANSKHVGFGNPPLHQF